MQRFLHYGGGNNVDAGNVGVGTGRSVDFASTTSKDIEIRRYHRRKGRVSSPDGALSLGVSDDPSKVLPVVVVVVTDDHKVYFCRSEFDPADYLIWSRTADKDSSYLFRTRSDFKLIRALYLHNEQFPQAVDTDSTQVKTIYKSALAALAKDVDKSSSR